MAWSNQSTTFKCAQLGDREVVDRICAAVEETEGLSVARIRVSAEFGGQIEEGWPLSETSKLGPLLERDLRLMQWIDVFTQEGLRVRCQRKNDLVTDSATLYLKGYSRAQNDEEYARINAFLARLQEELAVMDLPEVRAVLGDKLGDFYGRRENQLAELERLATKLTKDAAKSHREEVERLRREHQKWKQEVEDEFEAKNERLEAEAKKREKELEKREAELDERLAEVDDSESRYARRQIRKELKKELQAYAEKFELTQGTQKLREPVRTTALWLLWLFGILFVGALGLGVWESFQSDLTNWEIGMIIARQAVLGVAFGSTAIFYIRWSDRWLQQHAKEEFGLKRLKLDFERASWIVEMALDWSQERDGELPEELLGRLSSGLFESTDEGESELHPADQLASALVGSAAGIELEVPGKGKVTLDRKGIKDLAKSEK